MEIETGRDLETFDSMRRVTRLAALGLFALALAGCGGASGGGTGSGGGSCTGAAGPGLFFAASDGVSGVELWKTNGTDVGTVLVKDINPGPGNSAPLGFTVFNGALYFAANDGASGFELWKTDGTPGGTLLVKDI